MSYDLQLWSSLLADLPSALPEPELWRAEGRLWIRGGRGWQVVVGPQHRVEFEDIPADVHAVLPGVQHID